MNRLRAAAPVAVVVLALLVPAGCGTSTPKTASPHRGGVAGMAKVAQRQVRRAALVAPGFLVYLRQGKDERVLAVGKASLDPERDLVADDTVMIASVTKTMVAAVAMALVGDGVLGLDDPVEKWVPGLLPDGGTITITHLLSMASGIPTYDSATGFPGPGVLTARQLVGLVARGGRHFTPGEAGEESNSNYAVLQLVLEAAGKAPLATQLQTRVFGPAGLTHTSLGGTPTASGYLHDLDKTVRDPKVPSAAAGGVASVADVGHFLRDLLGGRLVRQAQVKDMEKARSDVEGEHYGLALRIRRLSCGEAFGQNGGNDGYAVRAWELPGRDRTLVVAATSGVAENGIDAMVEPVLCD